MKWLRDFVEFSLFPPPYLFIGPLAAEQRARDEETQRQLEMGRVIDWKKIDEKAGIRTIDLIVARPDEDRIHLNIVVAGKTEVFTMRRSAAASAVATIAEALSKAP